MGNFDHAEERRCRSFGLLHAVLDAQAGQTLITGYCRGSETPPRLLLDGEPVATARTGLRIEALDLCNGSPVRVGEHVKWRLAYYGPISCNAALEIHPEPDSGLDVLPVRPDLILTLDDADQLADPDISVQSVSPATWYTPPAPASIHCFQDMHPRAAAPKWYSAPRYVPAQAIVTLTDAVVSGYSAIYTNSGNLLREGFRGYPYEHEFIQRLSKEARGHITPLHGNRVALHQQGDVQLLEDEALFLGIRYLGTTGRHEDLSNSAIPHREPFGHWIFEYAPRLWGMAELQNRELLLLLPQDAPEYAVKQLAMLGFPQSQIALYDPARPVRCKRLHVPTAPGCHSKFLSAQFETFRDLFWQRADKSDAFSSACSALEQSSRTNRIYVARSDVPARRPFSSEASLILELRQLGFRIIIPGELDEVEKIALFSRADVVVGPMGSGLLNVAYARSAPQVVALLPDLMADRALSDIATYVPMTLHYIFGRSDAQTQAEGWSAPWTIDVDQTVAAIKKILNKHDVTS